MCAMSTGENVQQAIELMAKGSYDLAYLHAANAVTLTINKADGTDGISELATQRYIKENFELISFMGMPNALPLPLDIPFKVKRMIPAFNVLHGAEEIVTLMLIETIKFGRMPDVFAAGSSGKFEVRGGRLCLPSGLVCGLLGSVIFDPVNAGEQIAEECWISISDFKMFVSELFGRRDLAQRIMKFYLT